VVDLAPVGPILREEPPDQEPAEHMHERRPSMAGTATVARADALAQPPDRDDVVDSTKSSAVGAAGAFPTYSA
jgi:hypothetical protein